MDLQVCPAYAAMTDSRKGDYLEHYVVSRLLKEGAEVFRNVSCVGKADLVAKLKDQDIYYPFDVKGKQLMPKTADRDLENPRMYWVLTGGQARKNCDEVYLILVTPDSGGFQINWRTDRKGNLQCPPGWEKMFDD